MARKNKFRRIQDEQRRMRDQRLKADGRNVASPHSDSEGDPALNLPTNGKPAKKKKQEVDAVSKGSSASKARRTGGAKKHRKNTTTRAMSPVAKEAGTKAEGKVARRNGAKKKRKIDAVSKDSPASKARRAVEAKTKKRTNLAAKAEPPISNNALAATDRERMRKKKTLPQATASELKASTPKPTYPPRISRVSLKPEHRVRLGNGRTVEIGGLRNDTGERFVWLREGPRFLLMRYSDWHSGGGDASAVLKDRGFTIIRSMNAIRDAVDQLRRFPRMPIVTKPGWCSVGFVIADGSVLVPDGQPEPLRAFTPVSGMLGQSGSLEAWLMSVAGPLADHLLASFFMMTMFAPALLVPIARTDNIGLELSGEAGRGKSTLQYLMSSAAGPAIGGGDETYWRSLNVTMNALETVLKWYNDMPLILDEAGLVQGAGKEEARAQAMREMAFRMSAGQVKHRFGEPAGPRYRTVYMMSTNRPIASLLGSAHTAESDAIADRLITVPLLADRQYGIFDHCPPSYTSTGAFADALKRAAADNYGHALPRYLQYLVGERARAPEQLRDEINADIGRVVQRSGADPSDGSQRRVAEAFGLIYAAGRRAKRAGALPSSYRCMSAALLAFNLHRAHGRQTVSFDDRLRSLMSHPETIDLVNVDVGSLPTKQRSRCPVFLYTGRSGNRELLIPIKHVDRVFPGWRGMSDDFDVERRLKPSSDRKVLERPIGRNGEQRPCYVFDITDLFV